MRLEEYKEPDVKWALRARGCAWSTKGKPMNLQEADDNDGGSRDDASGFECMEIRPASRSYGRIPADLRGFVGQLPATRVVVLKGCQLAPKKG